MQYILPDPGTGSVVAFNMGIVGLMILTVGGGTHSIEFQTIIGTGHTISYVDDASAQAAWDAIIAHVGAVQL